jgi:DNA-nicking Smr family endonuclease
MVKKTKVTSEDLAAFYKAVEGVKPLTSPKKALLTPPAAAKRILPPSLTAPSFSLNEQEEVDTVGSEAVLNYKQNGISDKTLRKLRKGQYNVEAKLDLHGMTVIEAKAAVADFLQHCLQQSIRAVLIVHGKGHHSASPILKNKINHWLRGIKVVLAFCSAGSPDGNRGAIYVLLKARGDKD